MLTLLVWIFTRYKISDTARYIVWFSLALDNCNIYFLWLFKQLSYAMYNLKCRAKLMSITRIYYHNARFYIGIVTAFRLTLRDNVSPRSRRLHFLYSGFAWWGEWFINASNRFWTVLSLWVRIPQKEEQICYIKIYRKYWLVKLSVVYMCIYIINWDVDPFKWHISIYLYIETATVKWKP